MLRLPNEKKLPLMLVIFVLPLALLDDETGSQVSPALKAWLAGGVVLGVYVMMSFHLQAITGTSRPGNAALMR